MYKFEKFSAEAKRFALAASLGAVALTGCSSVSEDYQSCPVGWEVGNEPLKNPSESYEQLQEEVAELRQQTGYVGAAEKNGVPAEIVGAMPQVFEEGTPTFGSDTWDIGPDTLVDSPNEVICYSDNNGEKTYFYTPEARSSIGALKSIGIVSDDKEG